MLARWASAVVTHYTRLGPLKAITSDFRKSFEKRNSKMVEESHKKLTKKAMKKLEDQLVKQNTELEELSKAIKQMEKNNAPKRYARNNATNVTHLALTSIEEFGVKAKALCGWKYPKGDFELLLDAPGRRSDTCDTCIIALRASLQQ